MREGLSWLRAPGRQRCSAAGEIGRIGGFCLLVPSANAGGTGKQSKARVRVGVVRIRFFYRVVRKPADNNEANDFLVGQVFNLPSKGDTPWGTAAAKFAQLHRGCTGGSSIDGVR